MTVGQPDSTSVRSSVRSLSVAAAMRMSWRVTSEKPDKSACSLSNSTLYTKSLTPIVAHEETLVKVLGITCVGVYEQLAL